MRIADDHWQVAIRKSAAGRILTDRGAPFRAVPNPRGMWAADPFLIEAEGKVYLFAELFFFGGSAAQGGTCAQPLQLI